MVRLLSLPLMLSFHSMAMAGSFWTQLNDWDMQLFIKINTVWTSGLADFLLPLMRDQRTWYPLYAFLLIYSIVKFRWKALPFIILGALTVTLGDVISSHFLKDFFGRIRPCHEERLVGLMQLRVVYCPESGSFTSSHAVNHFALAMFFYQAFKPYFKKWAGLFFLWAGLVSYAQVYVGVHYPGDVLGGAILGCGIGWCLALVFKKYFNFQRNFFNNKSPQ